MNMIGGLTLQIAGYCVLPIYFNGQGASSDSGKIPPFSDVRRPDSEPDEALTRKHFPGIKNL